MNLQISKSPIGLDGIAAAETVLSHVDGERGELIIAGERVGDLVRQDRLRGGDRAIVERRHRPEGGGGQRTRQPGCGPTTRLRQASGPPGNYPRPVDGRRLSVPPLPDCARKTGWRMKPPSSARCR